ncbi:MAG: S41 family peptidase [Myxococcales bacterium]|nr:S41 family peptidase [Myxococcales bacterium]MBP6843595.1 S41 family peptidase [Kofleriaceae bacterium]
MSRASHAAAFVAGCAVAAAVSVAAKPRRAEAVRYQSLDTFAQTLSYVSQQYVAPVPERQLLYAAARGMVQSLDAYSAFFSPTEYRRLREDTDGEFGGVGLALGPGGPDDAMPHALPWPIVDEVVPGSPAAAAGIAVDDRVVTVDGAATIGDDAKDERYWDERLRGSPGSRVTVQVTRPGWPVPRSFELVRAQVKVPSVSAEPMAPGIGYLAIRRFQEATGADAADALRGLIAAHAGEVILLDLRTDSGGLIDQAMAVADEFLDDGLIVTIRGRTAAVEVHKAHRGGLAVGAKVIALVNAETASAAEILAGALQDHRRATVLGMKTYGKGVIQTYFDLDDGSGLKLTTHRYLTPAGNEVEGRGITPDIEVPEFEAETVVGGADPGDDEADPAVQPPGNRAILEARLADDYQLRIAYQTAQRWLGSK